MCRVMFCPRRESIAPRLRRADSLRAHRARERHIKYRGAAVQTYLCAILEGERRTIAMTRVNSRVSEPPNSPKKLSSRRYEPGAEAFRALSRNTASRRSQTTLRVMRDQRGQAARRSAAAHLKAACSLSAEPLAGRTLTLRRRTSEGRGEEWNTVRSWNVRFVDTSRATSNCHSHDLRDPSERTRA